MLDTPECYKRGCKHYQGIKNDGEELTERPYCKAFPDGIPNEIAYGDDKHLKVRPVQKNKIIFEKWDMSRKQKLNKFKQKQKQKKAQETPEEIRIANLIAPLSKSPAAAKAFKNALQATVKG